MEERFYLLVVLSVDRRMIPSASNSFLSRVLKKSSAKGIYPVIDKKTDCISREVDLFRIVDNEISTKQLI